MGALIGSGRQGGRAVKLRTRLSLAASSKFGASNTVLTYTSVIFRSKYILAQDMATLQVDLHNWLYPSDTGNADFAVTGLYIEGGSFAGSAQVTWGGSGSTTVTAQTVCRNLSDVIYPQQFGLALFPAGAVLWLRITGTTTGGSKFPGSATGFATNEAGWQFNSANTTMSPVNGSGVINVVSGTSYSGMTGTYHPILVGLRNSASTPPAILAVGDSEIDNDGSVSSYLAIAASSQAPPVALLTISHGGRSQTQLATDTEWQRTMAYTSVLIDDHGTNAPTDFTSQLTYYAAARSTYGQQRVFHVGLYPQSLSSDSWATLGNQTFNSGDTQATAFNTFIATKVNDGTGSRIDGQWSPTSASIRDATNSHAWKSNGTANAYTLDGLHMNPNGAGAPITACATEFGTQLTTWLSGLTEPAQ